MIPLSVPHIAGNEWHYVKECLDTGWVSSAGPFVTRFEQSLAAYSGSRYAVACMNGTSGLHLCLLIAGVKPDDYVVLPNITFVASANSIAYTGAEPLLVDANLANWQLDLDLFEQFLEKETEVADDGYCYRLKDKRRVAAVMPVHVLGNMVDMDRLMSICSRHGLTVIEDATEALGSYFNGRHAGSFGRFGCFSFNGNKIISTGGGGMIVTDDEALAERARHLSTQAKVSPEDYIHDETGYNYRLVNVLAAIGVAQMEQLPEFRSRKKRIDAFYREMLADVGDIEFQSVSSAVDANCWLFTFATDHMRALIRFLKEHGIQSRPFWMPMNQLPMYSSAAYITEHDHSSEIYRKCISIPSSVGLSDDDVEEVVDVTRSFFKQLGHD